MEPSFKRRLYLVLEDSHPNPWANRAIEWPLMALIILNVAAVALETVEDFGQRHATALYVYQEPRNKLDIVLTQRLTRILKVKAAAKDVLAEDELYTSGAEGREYEYSRVSQGAEYSIALSAKF